MNSKLITIELETLAQWNNADRNRHAINRLRLKRTKVQFYHPFYSYPSKFPFACSFIILLLNVADEHLKKDSERRENSSEKAKLVMTEDEKGILCTLFFSFWFTYNFSIVCSLFFSFWFTYNFSIVCSLKRNAD